MRNQRGITLAALIITIVLMLILAGVIIYAGTDVLQRTRIEEVRTNMFTIQGRARISYERNSFGEGYLLGREETEADEMPAVIRNQLVRDSYDYPQFRIVDQSVLDELEPRLNITLGYGTFFVIDYNNNAEIFYSRGIDGKYSLSELRDTELEWKKKKKQD